MAPYEVDAASITYFRGCAPPTLSDANLKILIAKHKGDEFEIQLVLTQLWDGAPFDVAISSAQPVDAILPLNEGNLVSKSSNSGSSGDGSSDLCGAISAASATSSQASASEAATSTTLDRTATSGFSVDNSSSSSSGSSSGSSGVAPATGGSEPLAAEAGSLRWRLEQIAAQKGGHLAFAGSHHTTTPHHHHGGGQGSGIRGTGGTGGGGYDNEGDDVNSDEASSHDNDVYSEDDDDDDSDDDDDALRISGENDTVSSSSSSSSSSSAYAVATLNRTMAVLGDDVYVMEARRDESRSAWLDLARDHLNEYLDLNGRAASYEGWVNDLQPGEGGDGDNSNGDGRSNGVASPSLDEHFYAADSEHFQIWSEHPTVQLLRAQNAKAQAARLRFGDSAVDAPLPLLAPPSTSTSTLRHDDDDARENTHGGSGGGTGAEDRDEASVEDEAYDPSHDSYMAPSARNVFAHSNSSSSSAHGTSQEQAGAADKDALLGAAAGAAAAAAVDVDACFVVGDLVEVRDEPTEAWEVAVVCEEPLSDHKSPPGRGTNKNGASRKEAMRRCRKDDWDTAYVWEEVRHLDLLKQAATANYCPGSHALSLFRTPTHGYTCSSCQGVFYTGIRLFGCRKCDFDLCETCLQASGRDYSQDPGRVAGSGSNASEVATGESSASSTSPLKFLTGGNNNSNSSNSNNTNSSGTSSLSSSSPQATKVGDTRQEYLAAKAEARAAALALYEKNKAAQQLRVAQRNEAKAEAKAIRLEKQKLKAANRAKQQKERAAAKAAKIAARNSSNSSSGTSGDSTSFFASSSSSSSSAAAPTVATESGGISGNNGTVEDRRSSTAKALASAEAALAADQLAAEHGNYTGAYSGNHTNPGGRANGWGHALKSYWLQDDAWGKDLASSSSSSSSVNYGSEGRSNGSGGLLSRWGWGQPLHANDTSHNHHSAAAASPAVAAAAEAALRQSRDPLYLLQQHGPPLGGSKNGGMAAMRVVPPLPAQGCPSGSGNAPISEAFRFACQRKNSATANALRYDDGIAQEEKRACLAPYERLSMKVGAVKLSTRDLKGAFDSSSAGVGPRGLAAVVRQRLAHHRYPRLLALHVVGPSRLPAIGHTPVDLSHAFVEFVNLATGQSVRTPLLKDFAANPPRTLTAAGGSCGGGGDSHNVHHDTVDKPSKNITLGIELSSPRDVVAARLLLLDACNGEQWLAAVSVLGRDQGNNNNNNTITISSSSSSSSSRNNNSTPQLPSSATRGNSSLPPTPAAAAAAAAATATSSSSVGPPGSIPPAATAVVMPAPPLESTLTSSSGAGERREEGGKGEGGEGDRDRRERGEVEERDAAPVLSLSPRPPSSIGGKNVTSAEEGEGKARRRRNDGENDDNDNENDEIEEAEDDDDDDETVASAALASAEEEAAAAAAPASSLDERERRKVASAATDKKNNNNNNKALVSTHALLGKDTGSVTELTLGIADVDCAHPFAAPTSATIFGVMNPSSSSPSSTAAAGRASDEPSLSTPSTSSSVDPATDSVASFGEGCQIGVTATWAEDEPELVQALAPSFPRVLHLTLVSAVQLATAFTQRTARQRDAISAFMSLEEEGVECGDDIDAFESDASVVAFAEVYNVSTQQRFRTSEVCGHTHFLEFNETVAFRVDSPYDTILITVHHKLYRKPTKGENDDDVTASTTIPASLHIGSTLGGRSGSSDSSSSSSSNNHGLSKPITDPLPDWSIGSSSRSSSSGSGGGGSGVGAAAFVALPLDDRFLRGRGCALPLKSGSGPVGFHTATMGAAAAGAVAGKGTGSGTGSAAGRAGTAGKGGTGAGGGTAVSSPTQGTKALGTSHRRPTSSPEKKQQQHGLLELEAKWGDTLPGLSGGYA